jgi:hypothetical protein
MIYVGRHLHSMTGTIEPALINPDLPVAEGASPSTGRLLGHPTAYHLISPVARAAYLRWLAAGRQTDVSASLVLLFCFGLERRVVLDTGNDPAVGAELSAITAEVRRLRVRYGDTGPMFRDMADHLLALLELLTAPRVTRAAAGTEPAGPAGSPMAVQVTLARFAATATPVPADRALAWIGHHPALTRRATQERCPAEFDRLFTLRYHARHGAGLVPPDDAAGIRLRYQPASPGLTATLVCREDLPDVLREPRCTRELVRLVDDVAAALDPYSRWLARFPEGRGSLAATSLLPAELVDPCGGRLGALREWAQAHLDGRPRALIDGAEFWRFWSSAAPERMARDEAAAFIEVLALLGVGVEPDVRFGAPPLADGPAVLFRPTESRWLAGPAQAPAHENRWLAGPAQAPAHENRWLAGPAQAPAHEGTPDRPGGRFAAAAMIARCAAAVASAAGPVDPQGVAAEAVLATVPDLAMALRLAPAEQPRLTARLCWLLAAGVDADRLPRQTAPLEPKERQIAGRYLIRVAAAADPAIAPATVAILTRMYQMLGLDRDLVFRRLHEQSVAAPLGLTAPCDGPQPSRGEPSGGDEPIMIRPADPATGGYALPWTAAAAPAVALDRALIARKVAETEAVGMLLAEVFAEDEPPAPQHPAPNGRADLVAGLDRPHSLLLRTLAARPIWTRHEFAVLASAHEILPDGALDLLNEAALEATGAPVIEGDATLTVDDDVLRELLG